MKSFFVPLRGWHVGVMIALFFAVTIGVNATFITMAVNTHPGEDVPRSYYQGVNYNDTLERRRQQDDLGWSARFNAVDGVLVMDVRDGNDNPVTGLNLSGILAHPTDTGRDCALEFTLGGDGLYRAPMGCADSGRWRVRASHAGEPPFEVEHELWLP